MKILKTNEYDLFKKHHKNRDLRQANLRRVMRSIQLNGYIESNPIIVSTEMEVIDGQHRLEACRTLGIDLYYTIEDGKTENMMEALNCAQEKWNLKDFLNFYKDIHEVKFINSLHHESSLSLTTLFTICVKERYLYKRGHKKQNTLSDQFKKGLKLAFEEDYLREFCAYVKEIIEQLPIEGSLLNFFRNPSFVKVIFMFWRSELVDKKHLRQRILERYTNIPKGGSILSLRECICGIYNYALKGHRLRHTKEFMPLDMGISKATYRKSKEEKYDDLMFLHEKTGKPYEELV